MNLAERIRMVTLHECPSRPGNESAVPANELNKGVSIGAAYRTLGEPPRRKCEAIGAYYEAPGRLRTKGRPYTGPL